MARVPEPNIYHDADFARLLARRTGRNLRESKEIVHDFLSTLAWLIKRERPVRFNGVFTVKYIMMRERTIHDPNDMENGYYIVPEHVFPQFRVSEKLYSKTGMKVNKDADDDNEEDQDSSS